MWSSMLRRLPVQRFGTPSVGLLDPRATSSLLQAWRGVSGGMGRGDLLYRNPLSSHDQSRDGDMRRGLVHSSQSTEMQAGQLHLRKHHLHAAVSNGRAHLTTLQPPRATWSYLIPTLRQGIELLVPDKLYAKLWHTHFDRHCMPEPSSEETRVRLTNDELRQLRAAQRLVIYEVHQRILWLEQGLAQAELKYCVAWPGLFQRAWVVLPITAPNASGGSVHASQRVVTSGTTIEAEQGLATFASLLPQAATPARNCGPTSNQVYNLTARVQRLSACVARRVEPELAAASAQTAAEPSRRRRHLVTVLYEAWQSSMRWHVEMNALGASSVTGM